MERIKKIESKTIQKNLTDNFIKLMPTFYEMESSFLAGVYVIDLRGKYSNIFC